MRCSRGRLVGRQQSRMKPMRKVRIGRTELTVFNLTTIPGIGPDFASPATLPDRLTAHGVPGGQLAEAVESANALGVGETVDITIP